MGWVPTRPSQPESSLSWEESSEVCSVRHLSHPISLFFSASPGCRQRCEAPQSHALKPSCALLQSWPQPGLSPPCTCGKTARCQAGDQGCCREEHGVHIPATPGPHFSDGGVGSILSDAQVTGSLGLTLAGVVMALLEHSLMEKTPWWERCSGLP